MLTTSIINIISYFYPIGNTPAVSLIQDIPPGRKADILLLGCGDVRNILFTTFCNSGPLSRHLDITCCDLEPAVLARNVLLLSLISGDTASKDISLHWQIYYHMFLDRKASDMLDAQAQKLFVLSESKDTWEAGPYAGIIKFHDGGTLPRLRRVWKSYCNLDLSPSERSEFNKMFEDMVKKSLEFRTQRVGPSGVVTTGFRSAAPASFQAMADLRKLSTHYWKYGSMEKNPSTRPRDKIPNRMFASSATKSLTIHYGIDPLLGFPLATAYLPILPGTKSTMEDKVTAAARGHFKDWSESFRSQISKGLTIRMIAGDAVTVCHSLQHRRSNEHGSSNWPRDSYVMEPLTLDEEGLGPLSFDIIDSSNLADHLGFLNILVAASPLLKESVFATLYTESLVAQETDRELLRARILCGDFPTISILLGLVPTEYWTNASAISTVEESVMNSVAPITASVAGQMFCRMGWKRSVPVSDQVASPKIHFDWGELAAIVYDVYQNMFEHQNVAKMLSGLSLAYPAMPKLTNQCYNRSTLVALLKLLKSKVVVDWPRFIEDLMSRIENNRSIIVGSNLIQELYVQLELQQVYTMPGMALKTFPPTFKDGVGTWANKPSVVCITLLVPRDSLHIFTNQPILQLGTPILQATVQTGSGFMALSNVFCDLQLAFGRIVTAGEPTSPLFKVSVEHDPSGWLGSSPLFVSFFVPTYSIIVNPEDCYVSLGLQTSPMNSPAIMMKLGIELNVFKARLKDRNNVFVTQYAPCQDGYRAVGPQPLPQPTNRSVSATDTLSISANIDEAKPKISTLTGRIDIASSANKHSLVIGSVTLQQNGPYGIQVSIKAGNRAVHCELIFPCPVDQAKSKTRIARKSSYIEVIVPMTDHVTGNGFPRYVFSTLMTDIGPVTLNMPYLPLDSLPVLNTTKKRELEWLTAHTSFQMSARERTLRGGSVVTGPAINADLRVNYKESLFSMFISFSGIQGATGNMFAIDKPDDGGGQIIILVSSLRLDVANHTVVLDCAIIPLTFKTMPGLHPFLAVNTLRGTGPIIRTIVDHDELTLWREILSSQVERCRTWKHKPNCEYKVGSKIPLSVEDGEAFLCSCGVGQFPDKFITNVPKWDVAKKFATRAAISPCFSVPYVEQILGILPAATGAPGPPDTSGSGPSGPSASSGSRSSGPPTSSGPSGSRSFTPSGSNTGPDLTDKCRVCQKEKTPEGGSLQSCSRCKVVKYCTKACQTADWKEHKKTCRPKV